MLVLMCLGLGVFALTYDPGAALALFLAGIGALAVFLLIADVVVPPRAHSIAVPSPIRPVDRRRRHR